MNQKQLNSYSQINFTCDSCEEEYELRTAYSFAPNLNQLNHYPTYCINCVKFTEKELEELTLFKSKSKTKSKKSIKNWGTAPVNEVSDNTQSLNIDKRTLKKTGRVHLFATRVKKEWIEQLKSIAYEERLHYNELLEKALECYSTHHHK